MTGDELAAKLQELKAQQVRGIHTSAEKVIIPIPPLSNSALLQAIEPF